MNIELFAHVHTYRKLYAAVAEAGGVVVNGYAGLVLPAPIFKFGRFVGYEKFPPALFRIYATIDGNRFRIDGRELHGRITVTSITDITNGVSDE